MDLTKLTDEQLNLELARRKQEAAERAKDSKKEKEAQRKEVIKKIDAHVKDAYASIEKAQGLADEVGYSFDFELAYGMGGTYRPSRPNDPDMVDDGEWYSSESGWVSSSSMC